MIITIDGPAGSGKSTVAKRLAEAIGFTYFDSGAMYRAMTWFILENAISYEDPVALDQALEVFEFQAKGSGHQLSYFVNGRDVSSEIRSQAVTGKVSEIAAIKRVREALVAIQRSCSKQAKAVFEGRDMGSVVFPEAELKIFLVADPQVRAKRRFSEIQQKHPTEAQVLNETQVCENLKARDLRDSTREHSPLVQAEDAKLIDSSQLSIDEVVEEIRSYLKPLLHQPPHRPN